MHANTRISLAILMLTATTLIAPLLRAQSLVLLASSHFDDTNGSDGWNGTNEAHHPEKLTYNSGGASSNSIGYISVSETSGDSHTLYLAAPAKFLGDQRAAYNGFLRMQLKQSASTQLGVANHFVILGSSNLTLYFALGQVPPTNWSFFEVALNENVGWYNSTSNRLASKEDMIAVLKDLSQLWVQGEYSSHEFDQTDLDDVELYGQRSDSLIPQLAISTYAGVMIRGAVGAVYRIEARNALGATNWQYLSEVTLPCSPFLYIDQTSPGVGSRFYRAALQP